MDDTYSWIIKPTKAKTNIGKTLLHISRIPVANNNEYLKNQFKIVYSAESTSGTSINQAQTYYRTDAATKVSKWREFNWEETL